MRRILNLGLFDGAKRAYSLRRVNLELSEVKFFHPTADEAAAHGKVLPTLTPAKDWQPSELCRPRVISLGSGRFIVVDFLDAMVFDKDCNEMCVDKQFALFTGMEVAYSNGKLKNSTNGAIKDNDHSSGNENGDKVNNSRNGAIKDNDHTNGNESGNENGGKGKGKGVVRGLRMIKHKSGRYMFNNQQSLQEVL